MKNRNTIQNELNELNSSLNSELDGNTFSVPDGYFDGLANSILAKIKGEMAVSASEEIAGLSPLLAGISRKIPYSIPDNYFSFNTDGLQAFTSENEESLVLSFIDKEMPYEVPTGYFANVPEQVLQKISNQGTKVVAIRKRNWMRLAAAAVITGILAISGIVYFNNRPTTGNGTSNDPVMAVKKASTEELNDFIKTTAVDGSDGKSSLTVLNKAPKTEAKKLFADVSDKELDDFLDQMPGDDEIDIN
jgi:hypothetical protein